jgi:uncharacterized membrane protein
MGEFMNNIKQSEQYRIGRSLFVALAWIIALFLCSSIVNAAIVSGSIYDLALQKESNIIVEINTLPKQLLVSKGGDYAFNVNPGTYTLYAHTSLSESTEVLTVTDDGNYTLDIILGESLTDLPDFTLTESDLNVSLDTPNDKTTTNILLVAFIIILVIVFLIVGLYFFRHSKKTRSIKEDTLSKNKLDVASNESVDEYEQKILNIIKKEKRTTQKDVRKEIPLSEAKISLILTDLEAKGKIRKIKKGRGNILIFVKD